MSLTQSKTQATPFYPSRFPSQLGCFPQMKPEKQEVIDGDDKFVEIGVPKVWIEPLKALGFTTIAKLKEVEKPGKLANDLNGYKKKNKLDLPGLSPEAVGEWIQD
jgi:lysyl-tRNA synthetase class 2